MAIPQRLLIMGMKRLGLYLDTRAMPKVKRGDVDSDIATLDDVDAAVADGVEGVVMYHERRTFTETTGDGTYTATIDLPEGAVIHEAQFKGHVNWNSGTSAALSFGYTGSLTAYCNAVNVKTTDPGAAGPYGRGDYFAGGTQLVCTVTKVGTGANGRDTLDVWYTVPTIVAATKA